MELPGTAVIQCHLFSHLIHSNAFESNTSANASITWQSNASANASITWQSNANTNASFANASVTRLISAECSFTVGKFLDVAYGVSQENSQLV